MLNIYIGKGRLLALYYLESGFLAFNPLDLTLLDQSRKQARHLGSGYAHLLGKGLALIQEIRFFLHHGEGGFRQFGRFFTGGNLLDRGLPFGGLGTLSTLVQRGAQGFQMPMDRAVAWVIFSVIVSIPFWFVGYPSLDYVYSIAWI